MRVLLIKTSSMGDIIHTLPALTDAGEMIADIRFDWVIEDAFAEIPHGHPLVDKVIPVALRRWRKELTARKTRQEWMQLRKTLHSESYDFILDAQGLVKSALITLISKGKRVGLDWRSAREPLASLAYQTKYKVDFYQHAIIRMRNLFSQVLAYAVPAHSADFGLNREFFREKTLARQKYMVFLHGTTWASKLWPEAYWVELAKRAAAAGYGIKMSGGSRDEVARAQRIAQQCDKLEVFPYLSITKMTQLLANAHAAVAVDTGFGHLAAALAVPTLSLYGSTNPDFTGALGKQSIHLAADFPCAPCLNRVCTYRQPTPVTPACYGSIPPALVWDKLRELID